MADKDKIEEAISEYEEFESHWAETRQSMLDDIRFARLGEQWDETIRSNRARDGRPVLTINKCPVFARQVLNDARQNKPTIKIHPVDDHADVETAEVMNGLIRNIETISNASVAYDTGLENAVYSGMGFWRVSIDFASYDQFEKDILIERIPNPLSVMPDINSQAADASDWNKCFITEIIGREQFKNDYPDANPVDWKRGQTMDDDWRTEDDVRIAERWSRSPKRDDLLKLSDGTILLSENYIKNQDLFTSLGLQVIETRETVTHKVTQEILTADDVLETIIWPGRYIPIVPVYGEEFNVEGRRYFLSMFSQAKDPQRMFNYWRTSSTELVALQPKAPFIGAKGQFDSDAKNWASANTDNHAYLEYDIVEGAQSIPQRQPPPTVSQGALQEAMNADMDMKGIIGIQDPNLGIGQTHDMSGKAVREWKAGGDLSNFHFIDNFSRAIEYTGKILLDIIPSVYSEKRIQRVMGADGISQSVPINQPYQKSGSEKIHDFSKGKYDLTVETGSSYGTRRIEARESMENIVKSAPQMLNLLGDLIAKNMDWEGSDEMAKRFEAMLPPQIQALKEMTDIPEEARIHVAQAQGQMQEMQGLLQQKDQMLAQMDQAIKELRLQIINKQGDNQIKQEKIALDKYIVELKEQNDLMQMEMQARYDKELEALKQSFKQIQNISPNLIY
jgi:hypothetical protein